MYKSLVIPAEIGMSSARKQEVLSLMQWIAPSHPHHILAVAIDEKLYDLSDVLTLPERFYLEWITPEDDRGQTIIRHSCAHLLGHALKSLWPDTQMVIGPVISNGFYYDLHSEQSFKEEDLRLIEQTMATLAQTDYPVLKQWVPWDEAYQIFESRKEAYKLKILSEQIPKDQPVALYHHQEYIDLCRGPHVPRMGFCRHFKLMHLSGSYWRGDQNHPPLQRIYGTAWSTQDALDRHLIKLTELKKRDHRLIGPKLGLFHFQEEAPGCAFWHPRGFQVLQSMKAIIRNKLAQYGYQEVLSPQILSRSLWERSGHWQQFASNMFITASEERPLAIKPMSCPGHIQIFKQALHSYRDLPIRLAEFGVCHRNEPSGSLHGLLRVRGFIQDDAHIFCTLEQLEAELLSCVKLVRELYELFGFPEFTITLSTRPKKRIGEEHLWDEAEAALHRLLKKIEIPSTVQPGEGAFYGPKLEFVLKDSMDRQWQCGTVQLDFSLPHRFDISYIGEDGHKKTPVMIHRATLGSLERFLGIMLEHTKGDLPLWISPVQCRVLSITDAHQAYARDIVATLKTRGLRVEADLRNEKIGFKIREAALRRIPYLVICGDREVQARSISVRTRDGAQFLGLSCKEFAKILTDAICDYRLTLPGGTEFHCE